MSRFNYSSSFNNDDDISEADPNEIANMLKDTDDLDGDLFKGITKANFSKTMPAQNNNNKPPSISNRNKNFSFDDDPLADFDSLVGKPNQFKPSTTNNKAANKPPIASSNIGYSPNFNQTMPMPSKSKSLAEDLFGKADEIGFRTIDEPSDFKLNEKYNMNLSHQSAKAEDDVNFGGYQPSALSTSRNNGGMKRNVSFGDDLFGAGGTDSIFASLARKPAAPKQSEPEPQSNLMRTMPNPTNKSAEDWLGGSNTNQNNTNINSSRRKSIDFSLDDLLKPRDTSSNKANLSGNSNKNNLNTGSDLDWLGFKDSSKDSLDQQGYRPTAEKPPINTTSANGSQHHQSQKPVHHLVGLLGPTKDSMNSSFADSIENNDAKPGKGGDSLQNMNPMQFNELAKAESRVMSPNESTDGWLNNLMSKKGGVGQKKTNEVETNNQYTSNNNELTTSSNPNLSRVPNNSGQGMSKAKSSYFLDGRSSTPENTLDANKKFNSISMVSNVNYESGGNFDAQSLLQKMKHLESENMNLTMQLQHSKAHYELQIQLKTDSCDNQIRMIKEDRENAARLFKEEKELLQHHIEQLEKEKHEISATCKRKIDEAQADCDQEIDKLRQLQRESVRILKEDHEDAIRRIRQMKDTELEAAMSATAHTRTIESVLNLIEDNTKNLNGISQKVQMGHMVNLSEQEIQIRKREEELKVQEERLARKQREYENEIRNLNDTIQRLEGHLAEQTRSVAEERWKGKQQEKKLEALQEALMSEQRIVMERIARERNDVDRSKDDILVEQKRLMQQVYEEKRRLAEERAQIEAAVASYKDRQHKDSLSNINIEAEISVSSRRLGDEKARLEELGKELREREFLLKNEKVKLDERRVEIEKKTAKLEQMAATVNQKYLQSEELQTKSQRDKEAQAKLYEQENQIKLSHEARLGQIQQQLMMIGEKEAQINQEKLNVYKERQELEMFKSSILCTKCKEPVRDFGLLQTATTGYASYIQNTNSLMNSLYNTVKYNAPTNSQHNGFMTSTVNDLEQSKMLRQLKMQALRDKQFINEEKSFIETLSRSNSGHLNRSYSMNQLNSTLA